MSAGLARRRHYRYAGGCGDPVKRISRLHRDVSSVAMFRSIVEDDRARVLDEARDLRERWTDAAISTSFI